MPEETPADIVQALLPSLCRLTAQHARPDHRRARGAHTAGPDRNGKRPRILAVGCRDGVLATRLAQGGARVTALDASAGMLAAAHRRARAAGVEVDLVGGDAGNLPFPTGQFDCVVSVATLCFVDNPRRAIREMVRVLKPGGRLIFGELGRWNLWAAQRRVKGWLGLKFWGAPHFRSRGDLLALAADAGLEDPQSQAPFSTPRSGLLRRSLRRWTQVSSDG